MASNRAAVVAARLSWIRETTRGRLDIVCCGPGLNAASNGIVAAVPGNACCWAATNYATNVVRAWATSWSPHERSAGSRAALAFRRVGWVCCHASIRAAVTLSEVLAVGHHGCGATAAIKLVVITKAAAKNRRRARRNNNGLACRAARGAARNAVVGRVAAADVGNARAVALDTRTRAARARIGALASIHDPKVRRVGCACRAAVIGARGPVCHHLSSGAAIGGAAATIARSTQVVTRRNRSGRRHTIGAACASVDESVGAAERAADPSIGSRSGCWRNARALHRGSVASKTAMTVDETTIGAACSVNDGAGACGAALAVNDLRRWAADHRTATKRWNSGLA